MIQYAEIGRSAADMLLTDDAKRPTERGEWRERYGYLQYRLEQWQQRIARGIPSPLNEANAEANRLLNAILNIRANHLRGLAARCFLCTSFHAAAPPGIWEESVNTAAETVEILADMSANGQYRSQQAQCNYFLMSALGMLLLPIAPKSSEESSSLSNAGQICVSSQVATKARENAATSLRILNSQAAHSRHAKCLFDYMRELTTRLRLFDSFGVEVPTHASSAKDSIALGTRIYESPLDPIGQIDLDWCNDLDIWDLGELPTRMMDLSKDL